MDEKLDKKRNVCRSMGGDPTGENNDDFRCEGVDEFKFRKEVEDKE